MSDDEAQALVRVLRKVIDADRYPLSPRVMMLKEILAKLRPEPARPAASPEPKVYAPPSKGGIGGVVRRRHASHSPASPTIPP